MDLEKRDMSSPTYTINLAGILTIKNNIKITNTMVLCVKLKFAYFN